MIRLPLVFVALTVGLIGSAKSQDLSSDSRADLCVCELEQSWGAVTKVSGGVFISSDAGLVEAAGGTPLGGGSVLYTSSQGTAEAAFVEGCNVSVPPASTLSVRPTAAGFCVALLTQDRSPPPPLAAGAEPLAGLGLAAGAVGGLAMLMVGLNQSTPTSLD